MNTGDKALITSLKVSDLSQIPIPETDGVVSSDQAEVAAECKTTLDGEHSDKQSCDTNGHDSKQGLNLSNKNLEILNQDQEIFVNNGTLCPIAPTECGKDHCRGQSNNIIGHTRNVSDDSSSNCIDNLVCNGNSSNPIPISDDTPINPPTTNALLSDKHLPHGASPVEKVDLTQAHEDKCKFELAFVEKKPSIPGFGDDDDHDISTNEDGTDFWQMVSGKTEEELAKEAEEEREWLRCIEEEEKKHTEEERKKKILEDVAKNLELIEEPSSESEEEEEFNPPPVTDPKLIFDPAKVPDSGVIEDQYKEAMGFVDVIEEPKKKKKETVEDKMNDGDDEIALQNQEVETQEAEEGNTVDIVPLEITEPRSIEELEVELVEEAKKAAQNGPSDDQMEICSEKSDEAQVMIIHNHPPITHEPPAEPITLQESKVGESSVVYKLGVKKKVPGIGKLLGGGKKSGSGTVAVANTTQGKTAQEKEMDELERLAMQELLSEAKRGAELAKEIGPLGWQKSRVPPTNKRFLVNTLRETLRGPRSRRGRRSKSRSRSRSRDRRRSRSRERRRSRSRERRRSKSREKRRSRSRSSEHGSRSHRRTSRSQSRDGSRSDPKRSKRKRRSRSRSRSNDEKRRSRRSDSHNSEKSDSKKSDSKNSSSKLDSKKTKKNDPKVASLQKALVKPSKCGWSSDEDDFHLPTDQQSESTENDESKTAQARAKSGSEASEVSNCEFPVKSCPVIQVSGTPSEVSEPCSVVSENPLVVEVSVNKTVLKSNNLEQVEKLNISSENDLKRKSDTEDDIDDASPKKAKLPDSSKLDSASDDIGMETTASEQVLVKTDIIPEPVPEKADLAAGPSTSSGSKVDLVSHLEIEATLSTLDAIVETRDILMNNSVEEIEEARTGASETVTEVPQEVELDSYSESDDEAKKPREDNSRESSDNKPKSEGAMKESLDVRTRRKLDIVESALREIEENPVDLDESVADEKHRSSKKKKKHKEHKKHKHKHKSKHKKRKRSDD